MEGRLEQYGQMEKQRWEESERRKGVRRERLRRKKMQMRELGKSRFTVFFV